MKNWGAFVAWLLFLLLADDALLRNHWEGALVAFAALVLVPLGLSLLGHRQGVWFWLPAAGFCVAYLLYPAAYAAFFALPYFLWAAWMTVREFVNLVVFRKFELKNWVRVAALGYWATGAAWGLFFLGDIQPLGFDAVIVGLTAAHFYVAGFVLSVVVYCLLSESPSPANNLLGWGVMAGMPMVAAGITLTKMGNSPVFEWVSALGFAALAMGIVGKMAQIGSSKKYPRIARRLWLGGCACLLVGATLAALYALRFMFPIGWVNIPNMKVWHGTLNAVGFGWLVLHGWVQASKAQENV
ncbi:MAG: YndJ family transporter [Saprospiraceae bacterium]|nr:YndJ family transporter [Saprospiraceae bacterium]